MGSQEGSQASYCLPGSLWIPLPDRGPSSLPGNTCWQLLGLGEGAFQVSGCCLTLFTAGWEYSFFESAKLFSTCTFKKIPKLLGSKMSFLYSWSVWLCVFLFINLLYCHFGWGQRQKYVFSLLYLRPRSLFSKTLVFDKFFLLFLL